MPHLKSLYRNSLISRPGHFKTHILPIRGAIRAKRSTVHSERLNGKLARLFIRLWDNLRLLGRRRPIFLDIHIPKTDCSATLDSSLEASLPLHFHFLGRSIKNGAEDTLRDPPGWSGHHYRSNREPIAATKWIVDAEPRVSSHFGRFIQAKYWIISLRSLTVPQLREETRDVYESVIEERKAFAAYENGSFVKDDASSCEHCRRVWEMFMTLFRFFRWLWLVPHMWLTFWLLPEFGVT